MADLLFELVVPDRREREFRLRDMALENFTNEELRCRYRFGRDSLQFLTELLQDDLQRQTRRNHALTPTVQLLVALRFFASGSFLQIIGDTVGLSKSAVSKIITDVSEALAGKQHQFIVWPSHDEIQQVKEGFYRKGGFPGVIGCIDGTHVRIQGPADHENDFVNRKGFHSINVQAICNHKGEDVVCETVIGRNTMHASCWSILTTSLIIIFFWYSWENCVGGLLCPQNV